MEIHVHILYGCGDAQTSGAWCWKLARVDVGNLPHGGVHVVQVLALHHQDRLGWVKVELWGQDAGSVIRSVFFCCEEPEATALSTTVTAQISQPAAPFVFASLRTIDTY